MVESFSKFTLGSNALEFAGSLHGALGAHHHLCSFRGTRPIERLLAENRQQHCCKHDALPVSANIHLFQFDYKRVKAGKPTGIC